MDVNVPHMGRLYAITFVNSGTVVAPIVLPATNTGGIIIRTCQIQTTATTSINGVALYAGTNPPTSIADSTQRIILIGTTPANATSYAIPQLPHPLFIDPGFGLWLATGVGSTGGNILMTYDLVGLAP